MAPRTGQWNSNENGGTNLVPPLAEVLVVAHALIVDCLLGYSVGRSVGVDDYYYH